MKFKRIPFENGVAKKKKNNLFLNKIGLATNICIFSDDEIFRNDVKKISSLKLRNYVISLFQLVIL